MPNNFRPTNVFETRSIQDYFNASHLAKIRYACVRAVELDDRLGGAQNTDYFLACVELADAIRQSVGLAPAAQDLSAFIYGEAETQETSVPAPTQTNASASPAPMQTSAVVTESRADLVEEIGFPLTCDELALAMSKKKIVAVLQDPDNADISEDLGINLEICAFKKKDLIKFIYTGAK